ncbi:serine/threonine protein kinase [Actinomadura sp. KC216]|uniref:serine/threonine-protein kinase n=1 Tax=Actinomadura sp. KC216 TaxID=2530370 RepID=UPI001053A792|nr:serine/threonine-protein kinase [Actinomadura sp. KC216]TDB87072.1 serine/threonine protein kinase [Actinomadura sp. KC216]
MGEWRVAEFIEVRELGAGAQGRVVLARHRTAGTPVAIKYLTRRPGDDEALERLRAEAVLLGQVSDPYVARLYRMVESPHGAAIVMEAVDGVSLKRVLAEHGALGPEASLLVLKGSLLGLAAAHGVGVVHRDFKPANVVVRADGLSKLIDFGVAALAGDQARGGTPAYMAPEQWRGEPAVPATDVYAATCVFFECVTGRRPYPGSGAAELMNGHLTAPVPVSELPEALRPLLERGMAKEPAQRPGDAMTLVAELDQVAVSAYGAAWEQRGVRALAGAAVGLAALFPLVASGIGGGAAAGGAAVGTGAATGLGGKIAAAVAGASVVVAAGGAGTYVATRDSADPPARPAAQQVRVSLVSSVRRDRSSELTTQYVKVDGIRDPSVETRVNTVLRETADALTRPWLDGVRRYPPEPGEQRWRATAVANLRLRGPRLLSMYYYLVDSQAAAGYVGGSGVVVDLSDGRRLGARDLLLPTALTTPGIRDLAHTIVQSQDDRESAAQTPAGAVCYPGRPITADDLVPQRLMVLPTRNGLTFVITAPLAFDCSGGSRGKTFEVPFSRLRAFVRPAIVAQATAPLPTPGRS